MADMTDAPAKSCRVFVRYGSASVDGLPTEEDIREIFSVHGDIVGMFCVKAYIITFYHIIKIMIMINALITLAESSMADRLQAGRSGLQMSSWPGTIIPH